LAVSGAIKYRPEGSKRARALYLARRSKYLGEFASHISRPALYIEAVSSRLTFGFCIAAGGAKVDVTGWEPTGWAKTRPEKRVLIRNTPAMRGERPLRMSFLSFMFELLKLSILVKILKHLILSLHYIIFGVVMSTKFQRSQLLLFKFRPNM